MARMVSDVTEENLRVLQEHGYVLLGPVMDGEELARLQERINAIMLGDVSYDSLKIQGYGADLDEANEYRERTLRYRKIGNLHEDDLFLAYFRKPLFRNITRRLIGEEVALQRNMLFNNYPHEGGIGYHQDGGEGWNFDYLPPPFLTVWTALDSATLQNGCVRVVPGTHRELIPRTEVPARVARGPIVPLEVAAGEALLLHNWTLHGSERNESEEQRRAVTVCYCDPATRKKTGELWEFPRIFGAAR